MINQILGKKNRFIALANKLSEARDILFLGRGLAYPLALEGSLKLKEISYIHAEAYASGELKHGPIALIDKSVPVIILAPKDKLFDKNISNVQEVAARGGKVVLLSDKSGFENTDEEFWSTIELPKTIDTLNPLLYAVAVQLIAYYTAVAKGTDVDQPRNLAKSVTVE
jgi:glucosamine--fructose-6-phosphate aminotransferase (isomerizing)